LRVVVAANGAEDSKKLAELVVLASHALLWTKALWW
jgi:hypothetical protein